MAGARTPPGASQSESCRADAPSDARPATSDRVAALAGAYSLTLVNTVSGWLSVGPRGGTLELWANAEERRAGWPQGTLGRRPGPRPLIGNVRLATAGSGPYYELLAVLGSDHPDVEVVGTELYLGAPDALDAGSQVLRIVHVSSRGFWGTWNFEVGVASVVDSATGRRFDDPAGFFCALRRR